MHKIRILIQKIADIMVFQMELPHELWHLVMPANRSNSVAEGSHGPQPRSLTEPRNWFLLNGLLAPCGSESLRRQRKFG